MLRHALLLLATVSVVLAAVALAPLEEKPEEYRDCEGCWVSAIPKWLSIGESAPSPTECLEYHCGDEYVQIVSCGAVAPPCNMTIDNNESYPDCCQIVCPTIEDDNSCDDEPEVVEADNDEPEIDEPEKDVPEVDEPEKDELEVDEPEKDEPEVDEPEKVDPEEEDVDDKNPEGDEPEDDEPEKLAAGES